MIEKNSRGSGSMLYLRGFVRVDNLIPLSPYIPPSPFTALREVLLSNLRRLARLQLHRMKRYHRMITR